MKVTLHHHESYAVAGIFFVMSALTGLLLLFQSPSLTDFVIVGMMMACSVGFFLYARGFELLDETGIRVKTAFSDKTYQWSDVEKVIIAVTANTKGGRYPIWALKIKNRKFPLKLAYTKRSMECISLYYGTPDEDKWGKPPTLL